MVTDGGLAPTHRLDQVAGAHLSAFGAGNQAEQSQPDRVGQHLEHRRLLGGLVGRERLRQHRVMAWSGGLDLHAPTIH